MTDLQKLAVEVTGKEMYAGIPDEEIIERLRNEFTMTEDRLRRANHRAESAEDSLERAQAAMRQKDSRIARLESGVDAAKETLERAAAEGLALGSL